MLRRIDSDGLRVKFEESWRRLVRSIFVANLNAELNIHFTSRSSRAWTTRCCLIYTRTHTAPLGGSSVYFLKKYGVAWVASSAL